MKHLLPRRLMYKIAVHSSGTFEKKWNRSKEQTDGLTGVKGFKVFPAFRESQQVLNLQPRKKEESMRRNSLVLMLTLAMVLATWGPASAIMFEVDGKPATFQGYVSQSVAYSLDGGDHYDVEKDFNQALMNVFLEGDVKLSDNWSFYGAGMLTVDWMYDLKSGDSSWKDKRFNQSRDSLYIDDEWWQLLKEAHLTWYSGDFTLRIGKQLVKWGEMIALPVNDRIMPTDNTHGLAEVELETLYVPIPLVNARYDTNVDAGPFQEMGIQFVFNPNVDFIPSVYNAQGNTRAGIWAVDVLDSSLLGFPVRIGRDDLTIEDPDSFDSDYFEYGLRINGNTANSIWSLMAFTGRNNSPSTTVVNITADSFTQLDTFGNFIVNTASVGVWPREKFVGASWSTELPFSSSSLGGARPLLDLEVSYRFDDVFLVMDWLTGAISKLETDRLVAGAGIIWKMKVPWQKAFIGFTGNAVYSQYEDKDVARMVGVREDAWGFYFDATTTYKRWNLAPGIWYYSEDNGDFAQWGPYITWTPNYRWSFGLSAGFVTGSEVRNFGYHNKDNILFKTTYQF